jgi:poly-gamma-glutamate synthesis protein (capsule biosynthesis protein)
MARLFVCGDVMLGRGIDQVLADPCDPVLYEPSLSDARDYIALAETASGPIPRGVPPAYPWGDALDLLASARPDVRLVNLETSITRSPAYDRTKHIHYRVSPENASALAPARIDACTLANNHVLDWGRAGLFDTFATLDELGIARCGAGHDLAEALAPAILDLAGGARIAVFAVGCEDAGVPPWWAAADDRPGVAVLAELDAEAVALLRRAIEPWRRTGTIVVLSIHWGRNWGLAVPARHRELAHHLIDEAGVDVVWGHSSHHVKGIEVHHGRPILYGCGDLLTDYEGIRGYESFRGDLGLLYLITVDPEGALVRLEMAPTRMHRFQITRARPDDVRWLAATLARAGEPLGTSAALEAVEPHDDRLVLRW